MNLVRKQIVSTLRMIANNVEADNTNIDSETAMELLAFISHEPLNKEQSCKFLDISRSKFDNHVRKGELPKGRKIAGYKELIWYKDELREKYSKIKNN